MFALPTAWDSASASAAAVPHAVYVLRLRQGKYYVGKTAGKSVSTRFREHELGQGSAWTRLHPPDRVVEALEALSHHQSLFFETLLTCQYCFVYGLDHVRGSFFCKTAPDFYEKKAFCSVIAHHLEREFEEVERRLLKTGRAGGSSVLVPFGDRTNRNT